MTSSLQHVTYIFTVSHPHITVKTRKRIFPHECIAIVIDYSLLQAPRFPLPLEQTMRRLSIENLQSEVKVFVLIHVNNYNSLS